MKKNNKVENKVKNNKVKNKLKKNKLKKKVKNNKLKNNKLKNKVNHNNKEINPWLIYLMMNKIRLMNIKNCLWHIRRVKNNSIVKNRIVMLFLLSSHKSPWHNVNSKRRYNKKKDFNLNCPWCKSMLMIKIIMTRLFI